MPKELPVDRKYELMIRDDLVQNLVEKHKQWRKNCFDETLTQEVEQLKKQVKDKWNARLHWPESTIQGVTNCWMLIHEPYKAVVDARVEGTLRIDKNGKITFASFKDNGLIDCPPHKIPIIIDPTILTLHDGETVKEEVWEIVRAEILKRKNTIKGRDIPDDLVPFLPDYMEQKTTIKGRDFAVPAKEPEALAEVFRWKPENFEKHLRRYDQWERGLYLRFITYVEMKVTDPKEREKLFEKFAKADKRSQTITSSMPDDLARAIKRKENAVRKGVNIIYFAIYRKERPSKTTHNIRKFNCPNHPEIDGKPQCPLDCPYLIAFLQDFEKDMPPELPQVLQRECLDILGDSGNLIKKDGKYTIAYRNNDYRRI
ncbi:MAG: hypothetical protein KKD99_09275 [Proteobacteria bacterium]|nr:hypothetical protein [Pseudomonadota bacterium]MBU4355784.1 hypothetical protein [Pseudomonadota bacterium]MBU4448766.1 hypothetical protein [Pseudomonadota bacterium]MCG2772567.1 hypothetical protein [Desulfobacterales bacterium]